MVDFIKPKLLGTKQEFQNRFVNPINNGRCSNSTPRDVKIMKQRCHVLYQLLSGCVQVSIHLSFTQEYIGTANFKKVKLAALLTNVLLNAPLK